MGRLFSELDASISHKASATVEVRIFYIIWNLKFVSSYEDALACPLFGVLGGCLDKSRRGYYKLYRGNIVTFYCTDLMKY